MERDIGNDDQTIIAKSESFNYNPWHVERVTNKENVESTIDFETDDDETIFIEIP